MFLIFILTTLVLSLITNSTIEAKVVKTYVINYPNNAEYDGFGTRSYVVYDYDGDGSPEVIIVNMVNGVWIKGVLTILDSNGIEKHEALIDFEPYKVFVYNGLIGVIGYYVNLSTYGVLLFNNELRVVDRYVLNQSYPNATSIFVIPDKPVVYDNRVFFNIVSSYENTSYTDLVVLDMAQNKIRVYARTYNVVVESSPRVADNHLAWGPLILNASDLGLEYNLTAKLNLTNKIIYDDIITNNKLYLVCGVLSSSGNQSNYLTIYDLNNDKYYSYSLSYSTSGSLYIAEFNQVLGRIYLSTIDVFNVLTSTGIRIYLVYRLYNFTNNKLNVMVSLNTSKIGYVFSNNLLYLVGDDKLYIIDPISFNHAITLLENMSEIRTTIVEPIVLNGHSDRTIIILGRMSTLYAIIQLNITRSQPKTIEYPLNEPNNAIVLLITLTLILISLEKQFR